jgi:arsenite methyltransferase
MELWIGCVAGALSDREYLDKLARAGFTDAGIEVTRVYGIDDAREFLAAQSADLQQLAAQVDGKFVSGFIRATKPAGAAAGSGAASVAAATAGVPAAAAASCCEPSACCGR